MRKIGIFLLALVAMAFLLAFTTGCVETTTTAPDGTVTTVKAPAPGSMELANTAVVGIVARRTEQKSFTGADNGQNYIEPLPRWLATPPEWAEANPLDLAALEWHSSAWGTWGPGGYGPPYRPELYR